MKNHPSINVVTQGDVFSIDTKEFPQYPLGNVIITNADFGEKTTDYNVQLIVADKVKLKNNESSGSWNQQTIDFQGVDDTVDVHANTLSILNDLTSYTQYNPGNGFEIIGDIGCEAFKERFDNGLAGWSATFTLRVHNDKNRCLFFLTNPSGSGYLIQNCSTSEQYYATFREEGVTTGSVVLTTWPDPQSCYSVLSEVTDFENWDLVNLPVITEYGDCNSCQQTINVEYFVVAGGGAGGPEIGGGGGGGGILTGTQALTAGEYIVTVGAGGTSTNGGTATNGTPSAFYSFTAIGGGHGGGQGTLFTSGSTGGSGGGGSYRLSPPLTDGGDGIQGSDGGDGDYLLISYTYGDNYFPAGGGGYFSAGNSSIVSQSNAEGFDPIVYAWANDSSDGGDGLYTTFDGTGSYFAGGGGGSRIIPRQYPAGYPTYVSQSRRPEGGLGGGGNGGFANWFTPASPTYFQFTAESGSINTGGGGGGGQWGFGQSQGGNGGSGVVYLRYISPIFLGSGGIQYTDGIYKIHKFTSTENFTWLSGGYVNAYKLINCNDSSEIYVQFEVGETPNTGDIITNNVVGGCWTIGLVFNIPVGNLDYAGVTISDTWANCGTCNFGLRVAQELLELD